MPFKRDDAFAYYQRGASYNHLGEYEKTLADLNMAVERLPVEDRYWVYHDRANLKQTLGDYQGAAADREQAHVLTEKR